MLKITQEVDEGFRKGVFVMPESRETKDEVHTEVFPSTPNFQTPRARSMSWGLTMDVIWDSGSQPAGKLTGNSIPERTSPRGGAHWRPPVPRLLGLPRMSDGGEAPP